MKGLIILGIALTALSLATVASHAQGPAAPPAAGINSVVVPVNDPAYRDEDTIMKAGIPLPDLEGNGRPAWPRSEFALAVIHLLPVIDAAAGGKNKLGPFGQVLAKELPSRKAAIMALRSLTAEFAPEIKQMGQDPVAIEASLDSLPTTTPFPDVPKDHWAYEAVQTLRQKGIVIGYPDGSY